MKYLICILALTLAACSTPMHSNSAINSHQTSSSIEISQSKLKDVSGDWKSLANGIAEKTYLTMQRLNQLKSPISVTNEQDSPFSIMLHELIVTSLVEKGIIVKTNHDDHFYLRHDVDYATLKKDGKYFKSVKDVANDENVKVIVNSSLVKDDIYFMRQSDLFYVNKNDIAVHTFKPKQNTKTLNVVTHK